MTAEYALWSDHVASMSSDESFLNELAQVKARALLTELSAETVEKPKWSYLLPRILRNLTAATFEVETLANVGQYSDEKLGWASRQLALAWDAITRLTKGNARKSAIMNAAVAYQLAGYQANAACLARSLGRKFLEINKPELADLTGAFLQRLFLQVVILGERAKKQPSINDFTDLQLWMASGTGLAGEGYSKASKYFLRGNEEDLELARTFLKDSEKTFARIGAVLESNLVRSSIDLLSDMQRKSTWSILRGLADGHPRWIRYLKLLARGPGWKVIDSPSVSELWPSQLAALRKGLLDSDSSKIIKMPTSAGKTRVAELAIVHTLITQPSLKCVYIAPYRALVSELEQTFLNLFGDLGYRVSSVIGAFESDDFENTMVEDADVLVMTPEKLDLLQRARPEFLSNVRLFIMDEAQIADDKSRGVKFELLMTRLKRKLHNARFLFLSAVIPQETLEDFAKWLRGTSPHDIITSEWRPSIQRVARFVWQGSAGVLKYSKSEDNPILEEFVPGVVKQRIYSFTNPNTRRTRKEIFPDQTSTQTAAELAFKFSELGPVLVFCTQANFAKAVGTALETRIELSKVSGDPIPSYFLGDAAKRSLMAAKEWLGADHIVTRLLNHGISIHYGNLPEAVRKAIEMDFRGRNLRVMVSTNTLAQGVNLPIRTVIIHTTRRYGSGGSERIPARDYWNIAGRAGRAGRETDGTVIHIIAENKDQVDFDYYLAHRESVEPLYSRLFQLLLDLMHQRITVTDLQDILDPEVLALLAEEGDELLSLGEIRTILNETLTKAHADHFVIPMDPLEQVLSQTSDRIQNLVSDQELRSVYSSTGLSTISCEALRTHISENKTAAIELLSKADANQVNELIEFFLNACLPLSEMQSERAFAGNYSELMKRWMNGSSMSDLYTEFRQVSGSSEQLAKFVENFFGYRLPWGITATTKIASKVLGLDDKNVSLYATFFSSMTKYGVPNPVSSWAMAAGIPFREAAMKMASLFMGQEKKPDYNGFLQWLSKIDTEQLRDDFHLKSPILEDVSVAISKSGTNELLKKHSSLIEILPYKTDVKGIGYEKRSNVALAATLGQELDLIRDYDNPFDRNAIGVHSNGQLMGYLNRHLAQLAAVDVDCGLHLVGQIVSMNKTGTPEVSIELREKYVLEKSSSDVTGIPFDVSVESPEKKSA